MTELATDVQQLSLHLSDTFARVQEGVELFLVGGIVRDVLLGASSGRGRDLDRKSVV